MLSGVTIDSAETAKEAMETLHKMGAKTVIVSSSDLGEPDILVGFGSSVASQPCFNILLLFKYTYQHVFYLFVLTSCYYFNILLLFILSIYQ